MSKLCKPCGSANDDAASFCRACGTSFGAPLVRSMAPASAVAALWRKLSYQMTRTELRKLLGEPRHILADDYRSAEACETWTYEYRRAAHPSREGAGAGAGSEADTQAVTGHVKILVSESRVLAWSEPDWESIGAEGDGSA